MPDKDYLEQLEEDKKLITQLANSSTVGGSSTSNALYRAIERLDKEIKHVKWCRCQ